MTDAEVVDRAGQGEGLLGRIDRDLFRGTRAGLAAGPHSLTIVCFEATGTHNVQKETVVVPGDEP
jgi:hypothetical protein